MKEDARNTAKSRNFSLAFERMCNFVAIANTRDANETLRQLILQCLVVLPNECFENERQIREAIDILFGLQIPEHWFQIIFDQLVKDGIIKFVDQRYILFQETRDSLQKRINEAIALEDAVKNEWFAEIILKFPTLPNNQAWAALRAYLARAFRRHGIQTAALLDPKIDIAPEYSESLSFLLDDVLKDNVSKEQQPKAREAISTFLAEVGRNTDRAKYVSQLADGAFNYFSLTVEQDTAEQFRKGLQPLTLFFDTNFLFGVLDLHVNPLVDVSNELLRLTDKHGFPFELKYHEATEREMRSTIGFYNQLIRSRDWSTGLSRAAINARCISGIEGKYHRMNAERGIDADTFFKFYEHIDILLQNKNISIYRTGRQNEAEISRIKLQYLEFLSKWGKDKPEKIIEHDIAILETVRYMRSEAKSSIEAKSMLITCDYSLYRFDWEISRSEGRLACVVLPNLFLQILRPFIPSDLDFERSFAEAFALPEFRTIGSGTSKACSRLLCLLALYKDIPEETAARLLSNDLLINGLRKIEDDKKFQEYVESAIIAENASLIEEKAAISKQLEIEREQRNAIEREIKEKRIKEKESEEKFEQAMIQKERELESLKKTISEEKKGSDKLLQGERQAKEGIERKLQEEKELREKAHRVKEIYGTILGMVVSLMGVIFFIFLVHWIAWDWLIKHQNSYGIQGAFGILIFVSVMGIFQRKWRKGLWSASLIAGIIVLILSLLGGPK